MDHSALFKISYGLFLLTAREGGKDNGCIVNTVMQITDDPKQVVIGLNKSNYTHDMIKHTGICNVSILTEDAVFRIFRHYGFQSGRDVDKFANIPETRTENGVRFVDGCVNAVLSCQVLSVTDCGTHSLFLCAVTDAKTLTDAPSLTYQYYFDHIKPKPQPAETKKWVCKICGYVHPEETLPRDFICPWCKHGTEAFELQS